MFSFENSDFSIFFLSGGLYSDLEGQVGVFLLTTTEQFVPDLYEILKTPPPYLNHLVVLRGFFQWSVLTFVVTVTS